MNDRLSDDIKKNFMLSLTIELQDYKQKVFHNAPVSPDLLIKLSSIYIRKLEKSLKVSTVIIIV